MSRKRREAQQTTLFELELDEPPAEPGLTPAPAPRRAAAVERPAEVADVHASFGARFLAGAVDLVAQALVAAAAIAGARALGVVVGPRAVPGLALLLFVFSLCYTVVPLAFWGRTPGMAALGLVARAADEHPPTFAEALRRWAGGLLTLLLAGLPALLALGSARRSLCDRWSATDLVRA
jgi:uncharacterized RDD family membrane protein YckC